MIKTLKPDCKNSNPHHYSAAPTSQSLSNVQAAPTRQLVTPQFKNHFTDRKPPNSSANPLLKQLLKNNIGGVVSTDWEDPTVFFQMLFHQGVAKTTTRPQQKLKKKKPKQYMFQPRPRTLKHPCRKKLNSTCNRTCSVRRSRRPAIAPHKQSQQQLHRDQLLVSVLYLPGVHLSLTRF